MNTTRRSGIGAGVALLLGGCGFTLSRPTSYAFRSIHVAGSTPLGLGPELQRQLQAGGLVEVITDPRQVERADLVLEIVQELREKVVVGRTSTGAVRENQLRLRVRFRVRNREGIERVPETELVQLRDITFNESYVLAKTSEETLLYANMQTDMIQQILRRLAALQQI
jgi:LPS-assembly lipoprotein